MKEQPTHQPVRMVGGNCPKCGRLELRPGGASRSPERAGEAAVNDPKSPTLSGVGRLDDEGDPTDCSESAPEWGG